MNYPQISIVLGSYNRKEFLKAAIESIRRNGINVPYEIIVIDGGSTDGAVEWLVKQKDIITIVQHNHGNWRGKKLERRSWGYFMNIAFQASHGKYILMISDDSLLVQGAVNEGYVYFEDLLSQGRNAAALAFYWRDWPESQEYFVFMDFGTVFVNHGMYLRSALEDVNWIDETGFSFYCADGDLCLRLQQKGYEILDCPTAHVEHFGHANQEVRQQNTKTYISDRTEYFGRWNPDSEIPEDQISTRQSKKFDDPARTYQLFPKMGVFMARARVFYGIYRDAINRRISALFR